MDLQSAVAGVILSVAVQKNITSFNFDIVYNLKEHLIDLYRDFFVESTEGTFITPSVVPDKASFANFVRQLAAARPEKSAGCSVAVTFASNMYQDDCVLLEAAFDAPEKDTTPVSRLNTLQPFIDSPTTASLHSIDENRITFRRDPAAHARVKSGLYAVVDGVGRGL